MNTMNALAISSAPNLVTVGKLSRGPIVFGALVVLLFFGVFGGWAALAPLSSGTIAQGVVSPDSSRRVIQHLEGGIIKQVNVREGQHVAQGDVLMTLESINAEAVFSARREQWLRLIAMRARIDAQQLLLDTVVFPEEVLSVSKPDFMDFVANQQRTFEIRRTTLAQQESIFDRQIEQLKSEIASVESEIAGLQSQFDLIGEEIADKSQLLETQLIVRSDLLALQRQQAGLASAIASNRSRIAKAGQSIEEVRLSALQARETFRNEVAAESAQTNNEIAQIEETMISTQDVLQRTQIVSPVAGIVLNLRSQTPGGVIRPGEPILDIVPVDDDLIVLARLNTQDIDAVSVGLKAHVSLTPFASRNALPLNGEVTQIAADSTVDERTGHAFYQMRVRVTSDELAKHPGMYLSPGMPADVTVVTGERTMLQYLAEPFLRSLRSAFVYN